MITLKREAAQKVMDALNEMSKTEPCDCGCPNGEAAVVLTPARNWTLANKVKPIMQAAIDAPPPSGEREELIARLHECTNRIGSMCGDGRPPSMSIPVREDDDDVFITRACLAAADMLAADAPEQEIVEIMRLNVLVDELQTAIARRTVERDIAIRMAASTDLPEPLLQQISEFGELQNQAPQALQINRDAITVNLLRLTSLTKHEARAVADLCCTPAPQARELSDENLINIFRKASRSWPPNGPHSEQIIEFARAVLAADLRRQGAKT